MATVISKRMPPGDVGVIVPVGDEDADEDDHGCEGGVGRGGAVRSEKEWAAHTGGRPAFETDLANSGGSPLILQEATEGGFNAGLPEDYERAVSLPSFDPAEVKAAVNTMAKAVGLTVTPRQLASAFEPQLQQQQRSTGAAVKKQKGGKQATPVFGSKIYQVECAGKLQSAASAMHLSLSHSVEARKAHSTQQHVARLAADKAGASAATVAGCTQGSRVLVEYAEVSVDAALLQLSKAKATRPGKIYHALPGPPARLV
jgi:hypothetical protein